MVEITNTATANATITVVMVVMPAAALADIGAPITAIVAIPVARHLMPRATEVSGKEEGGV